MLEGKTILVSGAKGGLGSTVTRRFLAEGARVVGTSRSIKDADFEHPAFLAIPADIANAAAADALIADSVGRTGGIDAVVHLVGGFEAGESEEVLARMLDANLLPAWRLFQAAIPALRTRPAGRIVAIGSRTAVEPAAGLSAYTASKAALVALVRTLAVENAAHRITANVILPGTIDTAANRAAGLSGPAVRPEQIASMLTQLVSDAGSAVSGAVIPMYGESQ
jgi:NAD(P)-dependent dehydrogenase (short-subunit alcohol dehydrogenase family)